jgi:triosephosphate isomerase
MTRVPFVAGNWKMNKTISEARELTSELIRKLSHIKGIEIVLCPPFMALFPVAALLQGTDLGVGAQNMHWEIKGAFTGEVSPNMIREYCSYAIIGH